MTRILDYFARVWHWRTIRMEARRRAALARLQHEFREHLVIDLDKKRRERGLR
jgi:hypothetical protein